jgi:hypothetical protein
MGHLTERWSRASEEMKFYDEQLKEIPKTQLFQDILNNKAAKIQDPKTQLFNPGKKAKVAKRRVSSRTVKV